MIFPQNTYAIIYVVQRKYSLTKLKTNIKKVTCIYEQFLSLGIRKKQKKPANVTFSDSFQCSMKLFLFISLLRYVPSHIEE